MSERLFRLLERLQKLDDALRRAQLRNRHQHQRAANPLEMARLRLLKDALKRRLAALSVKRARAHRLSIQA